MEQLQLPKPHSPQFLRKRKFLMVLPVLVIPFVFLAFVSLGGGKGGPGKQRAAVKGFNKNLPDPHFSTLDTLLDKLGFYKKADEDSVKLLERIKQDSFHVKTPAGHMITRINDRPATDPRADAMLQKLEVLKRALAQPAMPQPIMLQSNLSPVAPMVPPITTEPDPQMEKLNGMLDKIMRIQHPLKDQPVEKDSIAASRLLTMPIATVGKTQDFPDPANNALADSDLAQDSGFYPVGSDETPDSLAQNTIPAVVEDDETLVSGSTVTLRITAAARINGVDIPRDNLLYGLASISGDRMHIVVSTIRRDQSIYPVSLQVYDLDGLLGIHIPGVVSRDVAKQSAGDGVGSMDLGGFDPSLGAQVANAGIQAGKNLLSKKIKLVQVSVKSGYQVLLKNKN